MIGPYFMTLSGLGHRQYYLGARQECSLLLFHALCAGKSMLTHLGAHRSMTLCA